MFVLSLFVCLFVCLFVLLVLFFSFIVVFFVLFLFVCFFGGWVGVLWFDPTFCEKFMKSMTGEIVSDIWINVE